MSMFWMVLSAFWIFIAWVRVSNLRDQGHAVGWTNYAELVFWIGMFASSVWSGIEGGRINRRERIERELIARVQLRETGLLQGKNR
jgi:hypothetical protein